MKSSTSYDETVNEESDDNDYLSFTEGDLFEGDIMISEDVIRKYYIISVAYQVVKSIIP